MKTEKNSSDQSTPNLDDQKLSDKELLTLLYNLTGQSYVFASALVMRWGRKGKDKRVDPDGSDGFVQIIPKTKDDGFFEWYIENRADYQFFKKRHWAATHFMYYWLIWKGAKKPQ